MKFIVKEGMHFHPNPNFDEKKGNRRDLVESHIKCVKGDMVEDEKDLVKLFPGKFELVEDRPAAVKAKGPVNRKKEPTPELEADEPRAFGPHGEDVSGDYEALCGEHHSIFKTPEGTYNVLKKNGKRSLNKEPLAKTDLKSFIEEL